MIASTNPNPKSTIVITKIDRKGAVLWEKGIDSEEKILTWGATATNDGYVIVGSITHDGFIKPDMLIMKVDTSGAVLWKKSYGDPINDATEQANGISKCEDGGFIITGVKEDHATNRNALWTVRIDKSGDTLWTETMGGVSRNDAGSDVLETSQKEILIAGNLYIDALA